MQLLLVPADDVEDVGVFKNTYFQKYMVPLFDLPGDVFRSVCIDLIYPWFMIKFHFLVFR